MTLKPIGLKLWRGEGRGEKDGGAGKNEGKKKDEYDNLCSGLTYVAACQFHISEKKKKSRNSSKPFERSNCWSPRASN